MFLHPMPSVALLCWLAQFLRPYSLVWSYRLLPRGGKGQEEDIQSAFTHFQQDKFSSSWQILGGRSRRRRSRRSSYKLWLGTGKVSDASESYCMCAFLSSSLPIYASHSVRVSMCDYNGVREWEEGKVVTLQDFQAYIISMKWKFSQDKITQVLVINEGRNEIMVSSFPYSLKYYNLLTTVTKASNSSYTTHILWAKKKELVLFYHSRLSSSLHYYLEERMHRGWSSILLVFHIVKSLNKAREKLL